MRKQLKVLLALGLGLGLAGTAGATPDLYHGQSADPCAVCHSLSSAKGWVDAGTGAGSNWLGRNGPAKCYLCHGTALYGATNQVTNAFGNGNSLVHMYSVGQLPVNLNGAAMTIPANYFIRNIAGVDTNNVDCITCHDVHSRTNRPYLAQAATIEALCIDCHGRTWSGAKAAGNTTALGRSTHPQNVPYTFTGNNGEAFPNAYTYRSDLNAADVTRDFAELQNAAFTSNWTLGAHSRTGADGAAAVPIDCQTCHVVHGGDDYPVEAISGSRAPEAGLLVAGIVGSASGATTRTKSPICQGCHQGGTDEGEVVQPSSIGAPAPKDHPIGVRTLSYIIIDRKTAAGDDDASNGTGAGTGWNRYWGGAVGTGEIPVCVTCHDVHGGINGTALYRVAAQAYTPGGAPVAQTAANWCYTCHVDGAPTAHHSNKSNMTNSQIVCEDCHGLPGTRGYQAHGDFFTGFVAQAAGNITVPLPGSGTYDLTQAEQLFNQKSALCVRCHDPSNPTTFNPGYPPVFSPALVDTPALAATGTMPARHGNLSRGTASHQVLRTDNNSIGQSGPMYAGGTQATAGILPVAQFPAGAAAYTYARTGVAVNNFAKYGVTNGNGWQAPPAPTAASLIICESCHNVQYNVGQRAIAAAALTAQTGTNKEAGYRGNLLLQLYEDDWAAAADAPVEQNNEVAVTYDFDSAATDSAFCVACHPFAAGTLPHVHGEPNGFADWGGGLEVQQNLGNWGACTVDPAVVNLVVYPLRLAADFPARAQGATGVNGWLSWRSGANNTTKFDCDACHRPHNAATTSIVLGNSFSADPAPLITERSGPVDLVAGSPTINNPQMRTEMCDQCHAPKAL